MIKNSSTSWINRNVVGLALNRFLSDLGHEAGTAILPLFLVLLGAPPFALGLIEAVSDGLSSFAKLYGGWIGDRIHRRRLPAAAAYILTGLTTGLYALTSAWPGVLLARAVGWAGRGFRSPLHDALLTDSVSPEVRGRAFGFDEAADTVGAIAGPLAAVVLVAFFSRTQTRLESYRLVFLLGAIPGILAAACILFLVREKADRQLSTLSFRGSLQTLPTSFRRYLVGVGIFGAGDFSHTLLTLRAVQLLSLTQSSADAGTTAILLYALHNAIYAAGAYPVGAIADRLGKRTLLIAAYGLAAVMNLLLILATPSIVVLALIFITGGAVYAAQQSLERAVAADLVPAEVRSLGFGVLATVNGIGDFISSAVVGLLWSIFAPEVGFAFSLVLSVIGAVAISVALSSQPSSPNS